MDNTIGKYTVSFGLALAVTSVLSALLVVVKELSEHSVLAWMKAATGHHWITHGLVDIVVFVALGFLLTNVKMSSEGLIRLIVAAVVISGAIIAGFYLFVG